MTSFSNIKELLNYLGAKRQYKIVSKLLVAFYKTLFRFSKTQQSTYQNYSRSLNFVFLIVYTKQKKFTKLLYNLKTAFGRCIGSWDHNPRYIDAHNIVNLLHKGTCSHLKSYCLNYIEVQFPNQLNYSYTFGKCNNCRMKQYFNSIIIVKTF